jgi:hypothetical protein
MSRSDISYFSRSYEIGATMLGANLELWRNGDIWLSLHGYNNDCVEGAPRYLTIILKNEHGQEVSSIQEFIDIPPKGMPWNSPTYRIHNHKITIDPNVKIRSIEWHWRGKSGPSALEHIANFGKTLASIGII